MRINSLEGKPGTDAPMVVSMETINLSFNDDADALFSSAGSSHTVDVGSELTFVVRSQGTGPTVLVVGGTHGDEFEGQIAVADLARSLDGLALSGTLVCLPRHNKQACAAGQRRAPGNDVDLNRAYGSQVRPHCDVAGWIDANVLDHLDWLIDLHSGGSDFEFVQSGNVQAKIGSQEDHAMRAALEAFGAPYSIVFDEVKDNQMPHTGTLEAAARSKNVKAISSELGGVGRVTQHSMMTARHGLAGLLAHIGGLPPGDQQPQTSPSVLLRLDKPEHYVWAAKAGLFEPHVALGASVDEGDLIATIHDHDPMRDPTAVRAPVDGVVAAWQARCVFDVEQPIAILCQPLNATTQVEMT